jgi:hypothetical protein
VQIEGLNPFTHIAYIPAEADLATIRFEKIRMTSLPTTVKHDADPSYCAEAASRDRGGSIFCPSATPGSFVQAYDESGNRQFTFTVYFRPEELSAEARQSVAAKKSNRADTAAYFVVSTDRGTVRKTAIDKTQSKFCAGSYADGAWTHDDRSCKDDVRSMVVTTPSDYITVKVNPVSKGVASAGIANNIRR